MAKIMINATALNSAGGRSIGLNFIKSLIDNYSKDGNSYFVYLPSNCGYEKEISSKGNINISYISIRLQKWYFRRLLDNYLKREIKSKLIDILYSMGNIALDIKVKKQILLIHWPYLVYPESKVWEKMPFTEKLKRLLRRKITIRRLKYVDEFFFQTETMKNRFKLLFGEKLNSFEYSIIPNSISLESNVKNFNLDFDSSILKYADGKKIFLCLTRYYIHKNIEILVKVAQLLKKNKEEICFIITIEENQSKKAKELINEIKRRNLKDYIINIGAVSWHNVPQLYNISTAVILPTLLESFSGIYIESMKFNKLILTSDFDFAKEVCGDLAIYFNPFDEYDIYKKIMMTYTLNINSENLSRKYFHKLLNNKSWHEITSLIVKRF